MTDLSKERQAALLKILHYIQNGGDFATAKKMFQDEFDQVDVAEITAAERELIAQGLDPRNIQYLCNVHADVFKGNIKENKENPDFTMPGHPVNTLKQENVVIKSLINDFLLPNLEKWKASQSPDVLAKIKQALNDLSTIDKHYARKETSLFPLMTKYGITAPPQVMWGVDDKIRGLIKQAIQLANAEPIDADQLEKTIKETSHEVLEMIFKEENIMIPMIDRIANQEDWYNVKNEETVIGYTLIKNPVNWRPKKIQVIEPISIDNLSSLNLNFTKGTLNLMQLRAILNNLPFQIIFVDDQDKVTYFGGGVRIFIHSKNAIGNNVYSCHPQEVISHVKQILTAFHMRKKDKFEFVFTRKDRKVIDEKYFAIRKDGKYLGCLEIVQDISKFRK